MIQGLCYSNSNSLYHHHNPKQYSNDDIIDGDYYAYINIICNTTTPC